MAVISATVPDCTHVYITASDPISRAGIASQLESHGGIEMVGDAHLDNDVVALVVADQFDEESAHLTKTVMQRGVRGVVLILTRIDDAGLMSALTAGVRGLLLRNQATPENLFETIRAVAVGEGALPPDLLGPLLDNVARLEHQVLNPRGLSFASLTEREINVLNLLADGFDTAAIGRRLFFSERTVKNIVHHVTSRLNLRNRTQAVAYALRHGLI